MHQDSLQLAHGKKDEWIAHCIRAAFLLVILAHATSLCDLDRPIADLWQWLYAKQWCHWTMVEAIVAAVSFFGWIVYFRTLHDSEWVRQFRLVPREKERKEGYVPLPARDLYLAMKMAKPTHRQKRAVRVFASLPVYLGAVYVFHFVKTPRPLERPPPTFWRFLGELAFGIWAYDFVFFWIHLAMHRCPTRWHGHMTHHAFTDDTSGKAKFLEAEAVVNHSFIDGAMQVFTNILVQNITLFETPKHKLTRFVHNILVTYLLTESHAGLDLPWLSHRLCPQLFGGAIRHEVHHHTHKHCYQQFFMYLDDIFGLSPPAGLSKRER